MFFTLFTGSFSICLTIALLSIIPDHIHPILKQPIRTILSTLMATSLPSLVKIAPFPAPLSSSFPPSNLYLQSRTYLMSTLNATPDSFSDGGVLDSIGLPASLALADIIDVGGCSTRPNAAYVSPEEEIKRVVPVLRAIRQDRQVGVPISIDTFRPAVAREAIQNGATCVNDVRALDGEEEGDREAMAAILRESAMPVVMMHSRGNAGSNKDYSAFGGDVVEGVRTELGEKVRWALKEGGLRRWNVIVDPGIGFSKTVEDNTRLIRELGRLTAPPTKSARDTLTFTDLRALLDRSPNQDAALCPHPLTGMPVLLGTSRKSFLTKLMQREEPEKAHERGYASAAAISAGVAQGADIVRVHDLVEMRDVVRVADAIWRSSS